MPAHNVQTASMRTLLVAALVFAVGSQLPAGDVSSSVNGFGTALYSRLAGREGNLFLSPYSLATALAMTEAGARGRTAEEIQDLLGMEEPGRVLRGIAGQLEDLGDRVELAQANGLWVDRSVTVKPGFARLLTRRFGAALGSVDFAHSAAEAREAINASVAHATRDKITSLVGPGDLTAETTVVLVNAIYFKAPWETPFDPLSTRGGSFLVEGTRSVVMPMMRRKGRFKTVQEEGFLVTELPYENDELSMVILLPESPTGLPAVEARLATELAGWLAALDRQNAEDGAEAVLIFPRFSMRSSFDVREALRELGMVSAFGQADFGGISDVPMQVGGVLHEAALEVTEAGSEASAATAVVMTRSSRMPLINVNHPFLLAIRHKPSGTLLFLGRVVDPT